MTNHGQFLSWLDSQRHRQDDTGALARGHRDGTIDLTWPDARGETTNVVAATAMAREEFDRLDQAGALRADGLLDDEAVRRQLTGPKDPCAGCGQPGTETTVERSGNVERWHRSCFDQSRQSTGRPGIRTAR